MSEQTQAPDTDVLVEWEFIDIRFRHDIDVDALFAAIAPDPDLGPLPPAFANAPDDMTHRFMHWGWTCDDSIGRWRHDGRPRLIGVYWDYTTEADDVRLMPRIAPFVRAGSKAVFRLKGSYGEYEGWDFFDGRSVARRPAERIVSWEWA